MEEYSEELSEDAVYAVREAARRAQQGDLAWVAALNITSHSQPHTDPLDGILDWKTIEQGHLVLPASYKRRELTHLHDNMGRAACWCRKGFKSAPAQQKQPATNENAPMGSITSNSPFELVCIDFLHLETCSGGCQYILVVMGHYMSFAQAYQK